MIIRLQPIDCVIFKPITITTDSKSIKIQAGDGVVISVTVGA